MTPNGPPHRRVDYGRIQQARSRILRVWGACQDLLARSGSVADIKVKRANIGYFCYPLLAVLTSKATVYRCCPEALIVSTSTTRTGICGFDWATGQLTRMP